jgi:hypothetical protein
VFRDVLNTALYKYVSMGKAGVKGAATAKKKKRGALGRKVSEIETMKTGEELSGQQTAP